MYIHVRISGGNKHVRISVAGETVQSWPIDYLIGSHELSITEDITRWKMRVWKFSLYIYYLFIYFYISDLYFVL